MKYYKNTNGDVFAYENEEERKEWGAPDLIEMSAAEIDAHLNPTPTTEQLSEQVRSKRNGLLYELDAIVINPLRWGELSDKQKTEAAEYRQLLLDVPQQDTFPEEVVWPTKPSFLE